MARALAIAAHPDDELFGGGYLAKLAAEGTELFLLITTRGEGGEVGEPPLTTKDRLGEVREQEQRRAAAALEEARARADEVGAQVAQLEAAASAVTDELDAALGAVDRQLAQLQRVASGELPAAPRDLRRRGRPPIAHQRLDRDTAQPLQAQHPGHGVTCHDAQQPVGVPVWPGSDHEADRQVGDPRL